ncbi:MAG: Mut7-C ubiquitin/RNAse domain-containing protein [Chloroflexi bacterium]|nr:Mut7-C ubiquitin/RNAse domain-containing protein [Chloroflexota bacterium]
MEDKEQCYNKPVQATIFNLLSSTPSSPHRFTASIRFYAELNDFLPSDQRQKTLTYPFELSASVKDVIEALGVPHTEVDLILANGGSVDFAYLVQDGDYISVYPVFEAIDITPLVRVRPRPLRETRFILDVHLGRLAVYLRMLGFDTLYRNDYADEELAHISSSQGRILLTRDRGLLKRSVVTHGYCVRSTNPRQQLTEVVRRFDLFVSLAPFSRCLHCNGLLQAVDKETISDRLPPKTRQYYNDFRRCQCCDHIYWPGSHFQRMQQFITIILNDPTPTQP